MCKYIYIIIHNNYAELYGFSENILMFVNTFNMHIYILNGWATTESSIATHGQTISSPRGLSQQFLCKRHLINLSPAFFLILCASPRSNDYPGTSATPVIQPSSGPNPTCGCDVNTVVGYSDIRSCGTPLRLASKLTAQALSTTSQPAIPQVHIMNQYVSCNSPFSECEIAWLRWGTTTIPSCQYCKALKPTPKHIPCII